MGMRSLASDDETITGPLLNCPAIMEQEEDDELIRKNHGDGEDGGGDEEDGYFSGKKRDHSLESSVISSCASFPGGGNREGNCGDCEEDDCDGGNLRSAAAMGMLLSKMSIGSSDIGIEADAEVSDDGKGGKGELVFGPSQSDDSDKELAGGGGCCSLPATPPPQPFLWRAEYYASENDVEAKQRRGRRPRRRSTVGERTPGGRYIHGGAASGESEGSGGGVTVIARPKGGERLLRMGLREVKACRDLGFELEHQRMMVELPARTAATQAAETSSPDCSSSPIAPWRISSPGDDPSDVKARLKVWAQAVALASSSCQGS